MKNVSIDPKLLVLVLILAFPLFFIAVQDLKILDNGLLLSCAYDGKIICWHYNEDIKHGEILKENQQLRCMDAVTESGTLLIGTNTFTILT